MCYVPSTGKSSNSSSSSRIWAGAFVAGAAVLDVFAGSGELDFVGCSFAVGAWDILPVMEEGCLDVWRECR